MRADSTDEFIGIGKEDPLSSFMVYYDRETHGIRTQRPSNREIRRELGLRGFCAIERNIRLAYSFLAEKYENYGFIQGNELFSLSASVSFSYVY